MIKRSIKVLFIVIIVITIYILVKYQLILINKLFVNEEKEIIGVDISSYQGDVDVEKLKNQGIKFIYIKATEGSTHEDLYFKKNWESAKENELLAGAYHFFSFDSSGKGQALNFINAMGDNIEGRLIPAVDIEYYGNYKNNISKDDIIKELKDFLDELENKYDVKPIIYTTPKFYNNYLKDDFKEYKMWISSLFIPINFTYNGNWYIWQYINKGKLDGYKGSEKYIDLNVINKKYNLEDLIVEK